MPTATSAVLLLLSLQGAAPSQAPVVPPPRPGMIYDDITGHYVPIIGYRPATTGPHEVVKGTKLERRRIGGKISEAPIGH